MTPRRKIVLLQLPIPPAGLDPIVGNVPLAGAYLHLLARLRGLESHFDIEVLRPEEVNHLSEAGLVQALAERRPWLVGASCYLWNVQRTLQVLAGLKRLVPDVQLLLGGPEVTLDNAWLLATPGIDYFAIGEGEQTFVELLTRTVEDRSLDAIPGLSLAGRPLAAPRQPLPNLNEISSPYLHGLLDAADERMLLLETIRGCIFKCKFCYYPKAYDGLYFLDPALVRANLAHARDRGTEEVVLLDPTLNQRRDFAPFLELLAEENHDRRFTYFGELRAEGITTETAALLARAGFRDVEVGLQSVDPVAQDLMDRKNNLRAVERGVRAMLDAGLQVKLDLIIGLPGDTASSVRRGIDYLVSRRLFSDIQVFNLAVLPGTAFRAEAEQLGLEFQPRPPYYVTRTPTLSLAEMHALMAESQASFGVEFDPLPPPRLAALAGPPTRAAGLAASLVRSWRVDLDGPPSDPPPPERRAFAFCLWLVTTDFLGRRHEAARCLERLLRDNPHSTLQIVLEPRGAPRSLDDAVFDVLSAAGFHEPSYLDRFYAVLPGRPRSAKRFVVIVDAAHRASLGPDWADRIGARADLVWRHASPSLPASPPSPALPSPLLDDPQDYEFSWPSPSTDPLPAL